MNQVFKLKNDMEPAAWENLFKKEFFEQSSIVIERARYATHIADPTLGSQWWRQVLPFQYILTNPKYYCVYNRAYIEILFLAVPSWQLIGKTNPNG